MRTSRSALPRLRWALAAFSLSVAAVAAQAQTFFPAYFDVQVTFGCNCESNIAVLNTPFFAFWAANPVHSVSSTTEMPPVVGQVVPPHYTTWGPSPNTWFWPGSDLEGWTKTVSTTYPYHGGGISATMPPTWSFPDPVSCMPAFDYYEDLLPPAPGFGAGDLPEPLLQPTNPQPYPWDINTTLYLQNGQEVYNLEQQLVVGYSPWWGITELKTPVRYLEECGLLRITLMCTDGTLVNVASADITATLENVNIPPHLDHSQGGVPTTPNFTNWAWPRWIDDSPSSGIPGSAGTAQASLHIPSPTTIANTGLLVRADRKYTLGVGYYLTCVNGGQLYVYKDYHTDLVQACTNTDIIIYTDICSCTNPLPPELCWGSITGKVAMLGPQTPGSVVTITATSGGGTFYSIVPSMPGDFSMNVISSPTSTYDYELWATMDLSHDKDYEYFKSPTLSPVPVPCSPPAPVTDVNDDFVMCWENPGIVQGAITLCGPADLNYWGGIAPLTTLQFATYVGGAPYDPWNGAADETLEHLSYIEATGGASDGPPLLSTGGGSARTEFDNPVVSAGWICSTAYKFVGNYTNRMAGLQGQASYWSINDLHLVFGAPVNLAYDIHETDPQYINQVITCGTNLTRNITHCFGLYTANVINGNSGIGSPMWTDVELTVSGGGSGYTVGAFTTNFAFQSQSPGNNEAHLQLFLPEGTYTYTPKVLTSLGAYLYPPPTQFSVTCPNACTNPCPCVKPVDGLVDWWTFDETAGSSANDVAGSVNNFGVYHNGPTPAMGAVGNALWFDGVDDYVEVTNHAEINFQGSCSPPSAAESFTIDAWVQPAANLTVLEVILDKRVNTPSTNGYSVFLYKGQLGLQLASGVSYQNYYAGPDLRDDQWHFIAVTVQRCVGSDHNIVTLYVDGWVVTFTDPQMGSFDNDANLQIGCRCSAFDTADRKWFAGCIDELEFYKRVLNTTELNALFQAGSNGKCKPISGTKFNDLNHDGVWESNEPVVPGWPIYLYDQAGNPVSPSVFTDSNGHYQFPVGPGTSVGPGTYTIKEGSQVGWVQTAPGSPGTYTVTVPLGQNAGPWDFGNYSSPVPLPKYVQWPDTTDNGLDVKATATNILADDFLCTTSGVITNILIWGSWAFDAQDTNVQFRLGIWTDVPATDESVSHPGDLVWSNWFGPGQFTYGRYTNANENFFEPQVVPGGSGTILGPDTNIWWYSFNLPQPFCQRGSPTNPVVYWLSVSAVVPSDRIFGWKTSATQTNDNAVFGHLDSQNQPLGDWYELWDPRTNKSLDLSFLLNGRPIENCQIFNTGMSGINGDVPVSDGTADPNYTLISAPTGAGTTAEVVPLPLPVGSWVPNSTGSQWLAPLDPSSGNYSTNLGVYVYELRFTLCCTNAAELTGQMAVDDSATLYLNGSFAGTVAGWSSWSPIDITSGFVPGDNVLDICVTNGPPPNGFNTGLRAELTVCCVPAPSPAPKYVQWPDLSASGLDVLATATNILADDFVCMNNGAITNIQIWGSWLQDTQDANTKFLLGIWTDMPASGSQPSHPDNLLWSALFYPGEYTAEPFSDANENFYDPNIPGLLGPDTEVVRYSFNLTNAFCQEGSIEKPRTYWLSVSALTAADHQLFGWKTSATQTNDNAVFGHINSSLQAVNDWKELLDPSGTNSLDLSFLILQSSPHEVLSGVKFNDLNRNGLWDTNEPVVPSWQIKLYDQTGYPVASTVTDSNGYYEFTVACGTYTIKEVSQSGWVQTAPASGFYVVTVGVDQQTGLDFGNYYQGTKVIQWPDESDKGLDVQAMMPTILADDFVCTTSGAITNIQIWGSWDYDVMEDADTEFMLGVWSDVPVSGDTKYSHPGNLLWSAWFKPGEYSSGDYANANENFYDPDIEGTPGIIGADTKIRWYSFNPTNGFCQTGCTEYPVVYWLSVSATNSGKARFGWKTCTNQVNDNAVFGHIPVDISGVAGWGWQELCYPTGPEGRKIRLALSFLLQSGPAETCGPTALKAVADVANNIVCITFSDPVDAASATQLSHYTLSNGAIANSAVLSQPDTVCLSTSPLTPGLTYAVSIQGVRNLCDLVMVPTTIRFTRSSESVPPVIIQVSYSGQTFTLAFQSQAGFRYAVEYKNALTDPNWTLLQYVSAIGPLTTVQDSPATDSSRFYQVVCEGPVTQEVTSITPEAALALLSSHQGDTNFVVLDVRTPAEYAPRHIKEAVNLDYYGTNFVANLGSLDKGETYLVYCGSGHRSGLATEEMRTLGFLQVYNMTSGFSTFAALSGAAEFLEP